MTLTYGKYRDYDIREVPRTYLEWLLQSNRETITAIEAELQRRDLVELADVSWAEKIVRAGFRALALQHHPDQGGNSEDMRQLLAANEQLKEVVAVLDGEAQRKGSQRAHTAA